MKTTGDEDTLSVKTMVDTFYLHLEFTGKHGNWSINLPFLCSKCGICCTLEDFLTAGEINANPSEHSEVQAKIKVLFESLGKMWEEDESKYDKYVIDNRCPFLINNSCSIYAIRPDGCRLFPKTAFGMQTTDCEALNRFKKMRSTLKKGRNTKEDYYFIGKATRLTNGIETFKPAKFNKKQLLACIVKLRKFGMTDDELVLFRWFNENRM